MKYVVPEQKRLANLRSVMQKQSIDAFLVTQRENIRYLTGFTGSAGSVIVTQKRQILITDFRYSEQSRKETAGFAIVIQKKDHLTEICKVAERIKAPALWFDGASLTVERARILRKHGLHMRAVKDIVAVLRERKDAEELRRIKKAIKRAEDSFRELRHQIRCGMTEREVGLRLEWLIRSKGSRRTAFDIIVASGRNGAMPHAAVTDRRLRDGDLVTIDFGAEADGYFCDITRTFCIGRPTSRQREIHELVLRAQEAAIKSAHPGIVCSDIDKAARDIITTAGYGKHFGHATGHGVGLQVHEGPSVSGLSKSKVEPGMVITIEPGVYLPGWGGIRIEDMILITENGPEILTGLPRHL